MSGEYYIVMVLSDDTEIDEDSVLRKVMEHDNVEHGEPTSFEEWKTIRRQFIEQKDNIVILSEHGWGCCTEIAKDAILEKHTVLNTVYIGEGSAEFGDSS